MNILYCGDKKMEDGLIISILSLLKNVKENINIFVFTMKLNCNGKKYNEISDLVINILDQKVKEVNEKNFVKKFDITELFKENFPLKNINTRFTPYCMLRLFSDIVKEIPDKILYLDSDVVCRKDCCEFYHQNINEYEVVGVLDYYGKWIFKNNILNMDYINSGVLLLNIKKIRKNKLFEKCRKECVEKRMYMPDQSVINKLCKLKKIDFRKYNEQKKLHYDTVFQHFTTSFRFIPWFHTFTVKPWQIDRLHNELKITEYDEILDEYISIIKNINLNMEGC